MKIFIDISNLKLDLKKNEKLIAPYLKKIHSKKQGFYTAIDDMKILEEIEKFAKSVKGKYENIAVLGIGGSALGAICLRQALKGLFDDKKPKLFVLDNIDPTLIREFEKAINYKKTLFLVITKSGTTPETMSQYLYFRNKINKKKLDPKKHFVFVTDANEGKLRGIAKREKIAFFGIPKNVGGRFSVLTSIGLLPAALVGLNIRKLISGSQTMRDKFLSTKPEINLPFKLASLQYSLYKKGKTINALMPYSQKLTGFTDWFKQLYAESLGKKGKGITPINALGVTDQHSQLQLYNDGPNDKLIIFIEVENLGEEIEIPNFPSAKKLSFNQLFKIEKAAVAKALTKNSRPNITIKIDKIDEENLGELFMFFEGATAFLGEFMGINAFNQPGVEMAKSLTKQAILKL